MQHIQTTRTTTMTSLRPGVSLQLKTAFLLRSGHFRMGGYLSISQEGLRIMEAKWRKRFVENCSKMRLFWGINFAIFQAYLTNTIFVELLVKMWGSANDFAKKKRVKSAKIAQKRRFPVIFTLKPKIFTPVARLFRGVWGLNAALHAYSV